MPESSADPVLSVERLRKAYAATSVFDNVSLDIRAGEFVALVGESGVGKSTLLNCIAGLDDADAGHVRLAPRGRVVAEVAGVAGVTDVTDVIDVIDVTALSDDGRALMRRRHLGFVFQAFHVLPHLNVAENVELPLRLLGAPARGARVDELLDAVGLAGLGARLPAQLSGGQLQRVAIARALVHRPSLLLADEPTGNLDPATAARVLELLIAQTRAHGAACLLVTHSAAAAQRADRVLVLTGQGIVTQGAAASDTVAAGSAA